VRASFAPRPGAHARPCPAAAPSPSCRRVVNPTRLREALNALAHRSFRMGEMNDAAELMETLFEEVGGVGKKGQGP
jgi:hypothetical protein